MKRLDRKDFDAMTEETRQEFEASNESDSPNPPASSAPQDTDEALQAEPLLTEQISIDDFTKVDLRVARVLEASEVPEA